MYYMIFIIAAFSLGIFVCVGITNYKNAQWRKFINHYLDGVSDNEARTLIKQYIDDVNLLNRFDISDRKLNRIKNEIDLVKDNNNQAKTLSLCIFFENIVNIIDT